MFAQTDHLILRAFEERDADDVLRMWNTPAVARTGWATDYFAPQAPTAKETFKKQAEEAVCYVTITLRGTDEYVGYTCLTKPNASNRTSWVSIALLPEHWGNGYGTEAMRWIVDWGFHQLALHRISLAVLAVNEGAIALYNNMWVSRVMVLGQSTHTFQRLRGGRKSSRS
jgi:RimJ/RimL family protein N-acetyltransferase